jgi:hypothetical protein
MLAALVLAALLLAAGTGGGSGVRGVALLAALSVLWLLVNHPMEGPVLLVVTARHGLTGGDLAGLVGLGLAAYRWVGLRRGRAARGSSGTA